MKKLIFIILFIPFLSCKKGDQGETGPAGKNGASNIEVYNFTNQFWVNATLYPTIDVFISAITQDVFDRGVIIVYARESGSTDWASMPNNNIAVLLSVGKVHILALYPQPVNDQIDLKVEIIKPI